MKVVSLPNDLLIHALHFLSHGNAWTYEEARAAVAFATACRETYGRLRIALQDVRVSLPPPYSPAALDAALATGDSAAATPLLREAMRRLRWNLETLADRLLAKGYPVATECAACDRPYLSRTTDVDALSAPLGARGLQVPLALRIFMEEIGGAVLASPADGAHHAFWPAIAPTVASAAAAQPFAPDPLWLDHCAEILRGAELDSEPVTLPVGFTDEEGFTFRQGHVLHLAPDALAKRAQSVPSAGAAPGSYAV